MICAFANCASEQGANVRLDVWPNMPHDFQAFGDIASGGIIPESQDALRRIGEAVRKSTP